MERSVRIIAVTGVIIGASFAVCSGQPQHGQHVLSANPSALGFENLPWNFTAPSPSLPVTGQIPQWLSGTLYRNGPVLWPDKTWHWFTGLGMIHAFHFDNGKVSYTNQFIRSEVYNQSMPHIKDGFVPRHQGDSNADAKQAAAEQKHRQTSSGSPPGHASENTCVTIRRVQDHLLSSVASTDSNEFDPVSLNTIGAPFLYNDDIMNHPAPSHAQTDPHGNVVHFYYQSDPYVGYQLYHVPAGERSRHLLGQAVRAPANLSQPFYLHSFALTENYAVICETPSLVQWQDFPRNYTYMKELGTHWHVVSRSTGEHVATFKTNPAFFMYHHANAYEETASDGSVEIVADVLTYPNMDTLGNMFLNVFIDDPHRTMNSFADGGLFRFHLPLSNPGAEVSGRQVGPPMEFPTIWYERYNTRKHQFVYGAGLKRDESTFFDRIVKTDVETGNSKYYAEPNTFPGEPIFVPSPNASTEDDGLILSVVLDATKKHSFLLILNAKTLEKVARADLAYSVPFGFHGRHY